jgi:SET domain-containing protein
MTTRGRAAFVLVSAYISPKAVKGQPSPIQGRGLIAVAPVAKDEIVAIKGGHIVDTPTLHSLPEKLRNTDVQIADGFHLVALADAEYEPVMLFLNHSCAPNVGFAGNVVLVAMRDVAAGEELTTDYALFDNCDDVMACGCGTASCRGTISGRDWQRPELQRKYGDYFSTYLLRHIRGVPGDPR